jgi:AcrR family transcriptional regulator
MYVSMTLEVRMQIVPKRKRASAYHHGDLRRALMDAALRVLAKEGVAGVKVAALAKRLGVTAAAPFRHFASREALLVAVAEEGVGRMVARMDAASVDAADPLDRERRRAVAYVRFAVEEAGYFRAIVAPESLAGSPLLQSISASNAQAIEAVLGRAHPGVRSKELAARSAGMLAGQALTFGLARMLTEGLLGTVDGAAAEALAWEVTGVLGTGVGAAS